MKKILLIILSLIIPWTFISSVYAASATISVSSSSNQVIVGKEVTVSVTVSSAVALGSWEYTLNYDSSIFKLQRKDVDLHYAGFANNANTKSVTYRYVFKALKSGNCKFYVDSTMVVGFDENLLSVSNGSRNVKTLTYSEYQASLSSNNNLKSLSIEGYEITPVFNKDTLEYTVQVNEDETSIKINGSVEDRTANVSGLGTHEVSAGNNTFDIIVIAQNGSEKTYKLNVEVIDKNPINIDVDGENYTLVKLASNLIKPESYTETTVMINEIEIPAFYSEVTEFTLVGLKDSSGNVSLFIYEDSKYTKYNELNFGAITIYPLSMNEEIREYEKEKLIIQSAEVEVLTLEKDSRHKLINGLNVETKEEGLYLFDTKDNTLVKFDKEYIALLENQIEMLTYATLAFAGSTLLALLGIISLSRKRKTKNKKKSQKEDVETYNEEVTKENGKLPKEDENKIVDVTEEKTIKVEKIETKKKKATKKQL